MHYYFSVLQSIFFDDIPYSIIFSGILLTIAITTNAFKLFFFDNLNTV
jgi:hypothetical protein